VTIALQNQRIKDAKDSEPDKIDWLPPSPSFYKFWNFGGDRS
jgi:hypothetical protein